jgi:hypothetical protein
MLTLPLLAIAVLLFIGAYMFYGKRSRQNQQFKHSRFDDVDERQEGHFEQVRSFVKTKTNNLDGKSGILAR